MTLTQFLVRSGRYVGNKITKQYVDEFHFTEEVRAKCLASSVFVILNTRLISYLGFPYAP